MTTAYRIDRNTIIKKALSKLQVVELGVTPDADTITSLAESLNLMIKAWQSNGIKLWTIDEYTVPLVASQKLYTIGPSGCDVTDDKPLKLIQAWLRNTQVTPNIDIPLQILSRNEYNILGSKSSTGLVNSVWYDPRVTTGELHVYLTPDSTVATNYTLYFVGQRPMTDIDASTDIPDFPSEWTQALIWGLADEVALEYGCHINVRQEIGMKADKYRTELEDWDVETSSTMFTPDQRMYR